jgi:hypothetical protein
MALGLTGTVLVIARHPHWWSPLVAAALVVVMFVVWYCASALLWCGALGKANTAPPSAHIESDSEFRKKEAARGAFFVAFFTAAISLGWDGGGVFSPASLTAIGFAYRVHARVVEKREDAEGVRFFRERKFWHRRAPFLFKTRLPATGG